MATGTVAPPRMTRIPVPASKQGHGSSSSFIQSKNRLMIYTDWANHYLEKARNKRFIADLQQDITDGVLLADVIEAVTNEKIKDIKTKPKNSAQMVENINTCLTFLASLGVSVDGLSAKDIKDGNLKAILGLFFSLSRFKQQQKTQQQTTKPPEQAKDPPSTPQLSHPGIAVVDGAPNSGGRTTPQVNGGEMLSRLPSPFKHSNKNPASISNLSTSKDSSNSNSNLNQSRGKPTLHGANSTSNDKVRSHLNQQNNNNNLQGSNLVSPKNNNNNSVSHRATSPSSASQSGIPTPGGRSLGRPTPTAEKQSNRTSASSTSSTSSTKSNPSKPSGNNKNSMLDKFKFFNSKEKEKGKSGVVKSASKTSNTSTTSTSSRSDTDSKTSSYSARSSSSTDAGASSSTTNGSSSPKLPAKTGKKSLARAFSTKRDNANTLAPDSNINVGKRNTPSPSSQNRTPSPNPSARNSPVPVRKTEGKGVKSEKGPPKECQPSPPTSKKGTKIGSLIPKSSSSQSGKSSKSSGSSQIPAPSSGIPKSASGKSSKSSKEDRKNGSSSSSQHSKSLYASLPGMNAHKTLSSGSPKVQSPASTPEGCYPSLSSIPISQMSLSQMQQRQQQMENLDQQQLQQQQILMQREHHPRVNLQEQQIRQEQIRQEQIRQEHIRQENERYDLMRQEQIRKNEQSRTTEHSSPCITVPRATAHVMAEITIPPKSSHGSQMGHLSTFKGGDRSPRSQMVSPSPSGSVTLTQTVNVVKPTCAMAPTTRSVTKADGNTQTNLSVLQRTITPTKYLTEAMKENSSNSIHSSTSSQVGTPEQVSSDSTPSSQSGHSSCDSIVMKSPASELLAAHDRATTNSPKLGVKMLNSHLGKPANNIAVVQPRHGEKVETTFDTEVRTETINKNSLGKETTFSEKETTFVDDAGETMDIKPMPPIMRALPYGYFRGYSGYSGLSSSRNFHIPGISVPQTTMYAASTPSRLGVNRPLFDHGKYYSGQIKRTNSNCPSVSDTDYGSDIDTYDYVSGYMSDGDILKSNRGEEWASGYLSEGGASLYARRLQQRFREGMQAVRECMQKSSGLVDDDSFDDSSSISSGDISDTIAEISTDENLTGSSQGALSDTNPYSSLKRTPKDLTRGFSNGGGTSQVQGKRVPNLGTSAFMGSDYNSDSGHIGWRKYSLPQNSKLLSSDPSDYAYPYSNGYDHSQWRRTDSSSGYGSLRKLSNASQPEFGYRGEHVSYAESEKGTCSTSPSTKRDCETNTDNSHLLETSMKRMQNARGANCGSGGSSSSFGYRRPLSNASNSSIGSNKSSSSKGSATVGSRLAKHGVDANPMSKSANEMPASNIPRPGSASARTNMKDSDLGPEGYCSNTLERERKKKNGISASKSTSSAQTERDFQSNTLGRRRLFGSKNSLSKTPQGLSKSSTLDYAYLSDYAYSSVHGSNLSLVSTSSSVYSSAEEKQQAEVRKLQRELVSAQDKVLTLQTQLNTNRADTIFYKNQAHVVAAFEQSLSNMTSRLQMLTSTAEQKVVRPSQENIQDSELNELRQTIEALKRQSGLSIQESLVSPNVGRRHTSPGMGPKDIHGEGGRIVRQMSSDSMSSINSLSSACSVASQQSAATDGDIGKNSKKNKKKGWLRSSFSKAFSRKKNKHGSISDVEPDTASLRSNASAPNSPLLQMTHVPNGSGVMKGSHSSGALCETEDHASVNELKNLLREKDMKLTDIRLEALSSAHQLEQLRETMNKMKSEMGHLKADNDRLQRLATSSRTLNISQSSLAHTRASNDSLDRSLSLTDQSSLDMLLAETAANDREGKRVTITVYLGSNPDPTRMGIERPAEVLIGSLSVSGKTKWDILDNIVRKIFKEYVLRVDPVTNLGLSAESVFSYHIGDITRTKDADLPELLPVGYLVGETMQISICLKGTKQISVDSLAFESMIPKTIIQRYVSLLIEHRRIILCGPSGTGKTYLAQKLAEHLVLRSGRELTAGSVATFNVDHKSSKDLRQYLSNIAEQCENTNVNELPTVIILDNLHHVGSLGEVFNGFLSVKYQKCPYIIGTMNQATNAATNLQLHHNFRWVLCANHMEPVKGFLGRYLRRKLVEAEVRTGMRNNDLNKIIDWVPKVWAHINKFLETHSSSDVTIGPRLFLSCPMDISGSQVWFTDLWNYSLVPYMLEAVREGLQVYGKRAPWEDPTDWVIESYPWSGGSNNDKDKSLLRIRPEDVGYDSQTAQVSVSGNKSKTKTAGNTSEGDPGDPLVNMLMRLQEAASYSSPQSNDSDSTSLDSHSSIQEFSSSSVESTL
ncbi:neuron navigator 2-like isoform X13 [Haliotis rufescens]|uniref:neuron navigator 2-like isoform X13 n=1 Tax=Haliotis rufescens TaxID=6454 RepID=UPI00201F0EE0|nr:neuron navigator 2-like isoform X13 [Haliotis rufescens]